MTHRHGETRFWGKHDLDTAMGMTSLIERQNCTDGVLVLLVAVLTVTGKT